MGTLKVVVGGQLGSEAKGRCVQFLAEQPGTKVVMRVAGPNAGHCVNDENGRLWKLRHIPAAATVPDARLLLGPGSEVNMDLLLDEIQQMEDAGHSVRDRIMVDSQATLLTQEHIDAEVAAEMNARLGSTASGVGAARSDRIWRTSDVVGDNDSVHTGDTRAAMVRTLIAGGTGIIEGTQGVGLGLHYGHFPQCTSSDCRAIDFLGMAGISPWANYVDDFQVWVVMRTRPIRVAGNSGPLEGETSWEEIGQAPEVTTVTKRVRRVGTWDPVLARDAVDLNGGPGKVHIWLSMLDYEEPGLAGMEGPVSLDDWPVMSHWRDLVLHDSGIVPSVYGTGPDTSVWVKEDTDQTGLSDE